LQKKRYIKRIVQKWIEIFFEDFLNEFIILTIIRHQFFIANTRYNKNDSFIYRER